MGMENKHCYICQSRALLSRRVSDTQRKCVRKRRCRKRRIQMERRGYYRSFAGR